MERSVVQIKQFCLKFYLTILLLEASLSWFEVVIEWNLLLYQKCPMCHPRARSTRPAALISDCFAYGSPKPDLRFCVGVTAVLAT